MLWIFCIDEKGVSQRSLCESYSKVIIQENAFFNKFFILPEFFSLCRDDHLKI